MKLFCSQPLYQPSEIWRYSDHQISLDRLRYWASVSGSALQLFTSYLSDCSLCVAASNYRSSLSHLNFGVPQGSFLGTLLFLVYMIPLQHILSTFKEVSYTCYTDDIHLYIHFKPNEVLNLHVLHKCLGFVKVWLDKTFLQLNQEKLKFLIVLQKSVNFNNGNSWSIRLLCQVFHQKHRGKF